MKFVNEVVGGNIPIKSWCAEVEEQAMEQAINLAKHPVTFKHVALMPDCHMGYGMPIGGVIACEDAVIPNAVGVDIGCGMIAIQTDLDESVLDDLDLRKVIMDKVKELIPVGEGNACKNSRSWPGFRAYNELVGFNDKVPWPSELDYENLGSLGGGNHFIELQASEEGKVWLMIHSGSRNLGYRIANHYHKLALKLNQKFHSDIPCKDLAFLPVDSKEGQDYIRDMNFALDYALESRKRMMDNFVYALRGSISQEINILQEINIHHNYAALEGHFGKNVWVHRKGATSAKKGELGIIPGSMGTSSYIVRGRGAKESFMSCSHGAGRKMSRTDASKTFTKDECDAAMEGIVFDSWKSKRSRFRKNAPKVLDLSEAPLAYKDIDEVIESELDLIKPIVKLHPLAVVKG